MIYFQNLSEINRLKMYRNYNVCINHFLLRRRGWTSDVHHKLQTPQPTVRPSLSGPPDLVQFHHI